MTRLILLIAALLLPLAAQAQIVGQARIIDGDTIDLAGQRIRLFGIDAPESRQTCQEGFGGGLKFLPVLPERPAMYECGRDATAALTAILRDRNVTCEPKDRDRYGRTVAICRTESGDIGAAMVRQGWAVDYTRYSHGTYKAEQDEAKAKQLGIWSGRFEMPEQWRREHR